MGKTGEVGTSVRGLFITSANAEAGKTVVAAGLTVRLRREGHRVGVFKPISCGCVRRVRLGLVSEDVDYLAYFADSPDTLEVINPVRYRDVAEPEVAARRVREPVDFEAIDSAYARVCEHSDVAVVEGVGGLATPVSRDRCEADVAARFGLPLVVVARVGLGVVNHVLLTLELARGRELKVAAVVLNRYGADGASLAEETAAEVIARHGRGVAVVTVPEDAATSVTGVELGDEVVAALEQVPLPKGMVVRRRGAM